jgi:dienelactone hydrolase
MKRLTVIAAGSLALFAPPCAIAADQPQSLASPARSDLPPLTRYGALPGVEDMSLSPDGKAHAILARVNDLRMFVVVDDAGKIRASMPVGDAKIRSLRWASPTIALVTLSTTENLGPDFIQTKIELYGAARISLDGQKPELVFVRDRSMAHAVWGDYGSRTIAGKTLGYFGGIQFAQSSASRTEYVFDHGRPALFEVDLATNRSRKVANAPSEGIDRDWLVDGAGQVAATLDIVASSGNWKIANQRGTTIASGKNLGGKVGFVALGKDGTTVIYSEAGAAEEIVRWFEVPLAGGPAQEVFTDIDIERIFVDPANGRMLGYLERGAAPRPVLFDSARQAVVARVYRAFPKRQVRIVDWSADFGKFLVHTSGNEDPGTWFTIDIAAKRADPIGEDYPDIASPQVGAISTAAYKAADGLDLDGILTLPPGRAAKNLPVVILPHGGPHAHDEPGFDWWAQAFASRGYAVFQPNFRGSTGRGEAFKRAGYGQWGRKMQTDLSDGLAELARQGIVDPRRACIMGASYGGYAALAGVTLQKGLYRCAVAVAPVSDLSDMYWTDYRESGGNSMLRRNLIESLGAPSTFAEVSPRKHARDADAPILLIHGKDDTVVPYRQSTAMQNALRDAGKPVELVTLRAEDHWLSRGATRLQMLEAAVGFVQKHNPAD